MPSRLGLPVILNLLPYWKPCWNGGHVYFVLLAETNLAPVFVRLDKRDGLPHPSFTNKKLINFCLSSLVHDNQFFSLPFFHFLEDFAVAMDTCAKTSLCLCHNCSGVGAVFWKITWAPNGFGFFFFPSFFHKRSLLIEEESATRPKILWYFGPQWMVSLISYIINNHVILFYFCIICFRA